MTSQVPRWLGTLFGQRFALITTRGYCVLCITPANIKITGPAELAALRSASPLVLILSVVTPRSLLALFVPQRARRSLGNVAALHYNPSQIVGLRPPSLFGILTGSCFALISSNVRLTPQYIPQFRVYSMCYIQSSLRSSCIPHISCLSTWNVLGGARGGRSPPRFFANAQNPGGCFATTIWGLPACFSQIQFEASQVSHTREIYLKVPDKHKSPGKCTYKCKLEPSK